MISSAPLRTTTRRLARTYVEQQNFIAPSSHAVYGVGTVLAPAWQTGAVWPLADPAVARTLMDILDETAWHHPDAPALDAGGTVLSYRELLREIDGIAAGLAGVGIGPGDRVGVRVPSGTPGLYLSVLGALRAGAAYVPVDVDDPDERAEMIWTDAGVCAVMGAGEDGGLEVWPGPSPTGGEPGAPRIGDDAWIIFTSGTTGRPKGVAVTHRSAAAFVDAEARLFLRQAPLGPGDRVLAGLSVAFDASCEEMWLAWRHGACLVPAPRALVKAGTDLGPWLVEKGITVVSTVPTLVALWPAEALDRVRLLIVGGEACPAELVERLDVPAREFWNTYGPTEATVVACASLMRAGQPVRIGAPLDGWELAVVDQQNRPVPWGEVGELVIGGVGTARYLDPAKDAEKFGAMPWHGRPERVYRSGDLVRADPQGLVFVGRADEQVKLGGRRIELGEVDAALQALPGVRAAAAAVKETPAGGQVLVGYLVPEAPISGIPAQGPDGSLDLAALRTLLLDRLPQALVPVLAVVAELPTRTSGKVDRKALPWPLSGGDAGAGVTGGPLHGTAAWLAEQWQAVLGVPAGPDGDFFALGGTSLAAAKLVSLLRDRYPGASVADLYQQPRLQDLADHYDGQADDVAEHREVRPVPRWVGLYQAVVLAVLFTVTGLRWVLALAAVDDVIGPLPWAPYTSWWLIGGGWLVLSSAFGRALIGALGARLLTAGLKPGSYRRAGAAHLRLWTAERLVGAFNIGSVLGTPLARRYARWLGCRVGDDVDLHSMPPVTGMAVYGDGCAVETEVDAAGWWLDGDLLHLGTVRIGRDARVGTRTMLMPGAEIGYNAEVLPGSCVVGKVPPHTRVHGNPARADERPVPFEEQWPAPAHRRSRFWNVAYTLALPGFQLLALVSALPAVYALWVLIGTDPSYSGVFDRLVLASVPLAVVTMLVYALCVVVTVRVLSVPIKPGLHPAHGRVGFCVWAVHGLMASSRVILFPFYASLLTPLWLRALGAKVGRKVEASTVIGLPGLMRVDDHAFLADDSMVGSFASRGGWLRLGVSSVGKRSFVGNSGIVAPGRALLDDSLVGVLSDAPAGAEPGSSWLGRPGMRVQRVVEGGEDTARTYDPPRRLVLARACVELCRLLPVLIAVLLGDMAATGLQALFDWDGLTLCAALAGVLLLLLGVTACLITTAAKWLLMGRFRESQRPLWSSFVWRNELFDTFVEELAMPWLGGSLIGTPFFTAWLRSLGTEIGRGVWCESHWFPETDLIRIGDGATVNRGVVVQTHLFHDRLMRMDLIDVEAGATVGPHSIVLLGATLGEGAVVGPSSLVMRGESVPAGTRWLGNPVRRWA
ncbi:non-ribosomal peptide synthetase-like protein [Streptacidiphilus sp. BW17]